MPCTGSHSTLFIPLTLGGPVNTVDGINVDQLKANLNLAADVYISKVKVVPCGGSNIALVKGAQMIPA